MWWLRGWSGVVRVTVKVRKSYFDQDEAARVKARVRLDFLNELVTSGFEPK